MTADNARAQKLAMFGGGGAVAGSSNAASGALGRRWQQGVVPMEITFVDCRRPIILRTVQGYFWHA